jgi:hypothetical protein
MGRLAKLTDLFEEGVVAPLTTPSGGRLVVWINKLSPFEMEQTNHEGRIARARAMLAIREVGTADYDLYRASMEASKPDSLIAALVETKSNEHLVKVIRDLHSDAEWKEKLETLEWSSEQIDGKAEDDPEVVALTQVLTAYQAEIESRVEFLKNELRMELQGLTPEGLREQYLDAYVEQQGMRAFTREQQATEVFYFLRQCEATDHGDGTWTHENCDHSKRWLEDRREVGTLPLSLLSQIREAYEALSMAPDVARFSDGPASSSASSGPSSKQEGSTVSGQAATPDAPGGTS